MYITITNHLRNIVNNIKHDISLRKSLSLTDEDQGTTRPIAILYECCVNREYALCAYLGESVFEQYLCDVELRNYSCNKNVDILRKFDNISIEEQSQSDEFLKITDQMQKVLEDIDQQVNNQQELNVDDFPTFDDFMQEYEVMDKKQNDLFHQLGILTVKQSLDYQYSFYKNAIIN